MKPMTSAFSRGTTGDLYDELVARRLRATVTRFLSTFPWSIRFEDWTGASYLTGGQSSHWSGHYTLHVRIKTAGAGRRLLTGNVLSFLDRYVEGEVDLTGNLYLIPEIRNHVKPHLRPWQRVASRVGELIPETPSRARVNVTSHYDIPEASLFYLDQIYRSYSCAIWERPNDLDLQDSLTVGKGEPDTFDSLEKAQWRKFAHAADYLAPGRNERVLDVGCGYPGFLMVMMDRHPCEKVVGWTHSNNQVRVGEQMLEGVTGYELNEGDYREDDRIYDHIHSTGMISHVGPPARNSGLTDYVRQIRRRIRLGGRYVHHAIMNPVSDIKLLDGPGPAFNRKYVWPGFYWYTLAENIRALESNGFQVVQVLNLTPHYAKTIRTWYERFRADEATFIRHAGEATARAWHVYLAGGTGAFLNRQLHCYRILCEATDIEAPSVEMSDPGGHAAAFRTVV